MKIAVPLGRLNKEATKIICDYFNLSYSIFNKKKIREFMYEYNGIMFYFIKPKDLMKFSEIYHINYAIISNDCFFNYENYNNFDIIYKKNLGVQRLSLITKNQSVEEITSIVTPYTLIAKKHYPEKKIIQIDSSLEIFPNINNLNGIIDIVETGSTINIHGLKEIQKIMETEIFLIANKKEKIINKEA